MAYNKLRSFVEIIPKILHLSKDRLISGNNIHHPIFQTQEAKKMGWGSAKIDSDPFFTTKQKEEKDNKLVESVKNFLTDLFKRNHSQDTHSSDSPKEEVH